MDIERVVEITAAPEKVWKVLTDVERWPEWTASVTKIDVLSEPPFKVGSRARIRQPRLPVVTWTVTAFENERYFEWQNAGPGLRTSAGHRVESRGPDRARVTLSLRWSGPLAPLMRLLYGPLSRRYVEMEAQGLKQRCEAS